MDNKAKLLTRVQLINWHFFENERIVFNRSTLISGENTSGKSTILDAIQLVLTTNSRKFNMAANEKGNRDLKGYVRCKVGNVGETYHRKGTVPANVALEFYDEKLDSYFVMGVHLMSVDEESPVTKKWYLEECRLEDLTFIINNCPCLANEFRNGTKRIKYMDTDKSARDRFRRRMGNLDEKFFDIIPKSLAFKPMDNVKDFINKFVLNEETIDIENLKDNIYLLNELENTLSKTKSQLAALKEILDVFDEIDVKERDIIINDILLRLATKDAYDIAKKETRKRIEEDERSLTRLLKDINDAEETIRNVEEEILSLSVSYNENEASRLVESLRHRLEALNKDLSHVELDNNKLAKTVSLLKNYIKKINSDMDNKTLNTIDTDVLVSVGSEKEKTQIVNEIREHFEVEFENYRNEKSYNEVLLQKEDKEINELRDRKKALEKRQLKYPETTERLKTYVDKEFEKRGINSKTYILSELLEITDEKWRDAVEGYLNTQKFYLIVEPQYVDIALEVYDRNRSKIHSAGIINTKKLPVDYEENKDSLAFVVKADNRYAKAYIEYALGRVIRCDKVTELENYKIAITPKCMLYQGYVVRHINPKNYRNPYIGMNAYKVQLDNVNKSIEEHLTVRKEIINTIDRYINIIKVGSEINLGVIDEYLSAPNRMEELKSEIIDVKKELIVAQNDPTLMEIGIKLEEAKVRLDRLKANKEQEVKKQAKLESRIENLIQEESKKEELVKEEAIQLEQFFEDNGGEYEEALKKYNNNRKTKSPAKIKENFSPQRTQFQNEKDALVRKLYDLQSAFNLKYSLDFMLGIKDETRYRERYNDLDKVEIVKYEEKVRGAKTDCEQIFRSDFLSKLKEYIENAKTEFRNLNKALKNVYYGEDNYYFHITFNKRKESLYKMITSEYNIEGDNNLWSGQFESEYKDEIDDLFAKLMVSDDTGDKVVSEYTDYRSYLDYDIYINKKNGDRQKYSEIFGEKSGSETQVPYYVAIAASFYQLYRFGNCVRLMLLDEAFDKMDDDRIKSMLDFINELDLQVIMATPPQKIEVIGEQVGCILTAIRDGNRSIVEEYEL